MNAVLEIVMFTLFMAAFFGSVGSLVYLKLQNKKLNEDVDQGIADILALKEELRKALNNTESKKIEETEGFLKFVSQSRDWAFQYIESVQIAIKNFQNVFHPIAVEYYQNKEQPISQEEFDKLFKAYKKLVEELPEEGKNT